MITRTAAISVVMRHSRRVVCLLATLRAIAGVTETFKEFVVIAINIVVDIIVVVVIVVVIIIVVVVVVVIIVVVVEGTNEKPAVNWMTSLNFTNVPKKISSQLVQWRSSSYDEFLVIKY